MIVTVTVNPLLEKRFKFHEVRLGAVHRAGMETLRAGGKGINVSRQLNKMGIKNQAITFVGGMNGKAFRRVLTEENIDSVLVSSKSETRWAAVIEERKINRVTSYFSPNQQITEQEANDFISKMERMIPNASIVVLAGSSQNENTDRILDAALEIANKEDKIVYLDTYGVHLEALLNKAPMIVHNNKSELEKSLGITLRTENDFVETLKSFYSKGIKIAYITNGREPFYAMKFGFIYKITPPSITGEIDATGSGDAFTAGVCAGLEHNITFNEFTSLGCKLGALNAAEWETCAVEKDILDNINPPVIESVGKKMKIIDDSPNYK